MKKIYIFLAIVGFILPFWQFGLWLLEFGFNLSLMFKSIIEDKLSLFAWLDVVISGVVLILFIVYEGIKQSMERLWIPILGTLCVGVSLGLPLFLFLREVHLAKIHDES